MVRIGLVIFLILFGPVEPLLCPCFARQFLSSHLLSNLEGKPAQGSSRPCCPIIPAPISGAPLRGQSSPCHCPCQSRGENMGLPSSRAAQVRESAGNVRDSFFSPSWVWWSNFASLYANRSLFERTNGAVLSTRDRLHVICLLLI